MLLHNETKQKAINTRKKINRFNRSMQEKNCRNTCPEQLKTRIALVISKLGKILTMDDIKELDGGLPSYIIRKYKTFSNFKKIYKLPILKEHQKEKANLVYDLRKHIAIFETMPWMKKKNKRIENFPHAKETYRNNFGSYRKAWESCGVRMIRMGRYQYKWKIIN